jgi:hypothetical protein
MGRLGIQVFCASATPAIMGLGENAARVLGL